MIICDFCRKETSMSDPIKDYSLALVSQDGWEEDEDEEDPDTQEESTTGEGLGYNIQLCSGCFRRLREIVVDTMAELRNGFTLRSTDGDNPS